MANKIFKGLKFPGMDDYYVLPEAVISKNEDGIIEIESMIASDANIGTDASLSTSGMAADAAAVGNALSNKASESFVLAKIAEAQLEGSDVDLSGYLTKENPAGVGSLSMNRKADSTIGTNSTTFGHNNVASGYASHAEGFKTTASGQGAHAEGQETTTSGLASHAEGLNTTASEQSAHAEGWLTTAAGQASHAEGYSTQANADSSHAEGIQTIAASRWQHVQGKYNIEDASGTYAHIVGNGDSSARSNAHTLDWEGNAWFAGAIDCEDTATTRANLGAAPAGLLSATHYKTSKADFESMLLDTFNAMEIGTVKMLQADLTSGDDTIPNGYWYITIGKRASGIGYIEMTKTSGLTIRRDAIDGVWGEWTHASHLYANQYFITSLDETDAILTSIVNDLDTYGSRFIMFNYNGQLFGCTVYRGAGNYSWAHADSYTISHDYKMHRILYGGVWQPWEYENPPMLPNVEYRTTERYKGEPVYAKCISYTVLSPVGDSSSTTAIDFEIPHGISNFSQLVEVRATAGTGQMMPLYGFTGDIISCHNVSDTAIVLRLYKTALYGTSLSFCLYYTKTT